MSSTSISLIQPLSEAQRNPRAGSKAANLSRVIAARYTVPRGFVISADAYRSHLWASGVRTAASSPDEAENRETLRNAILAQNIPEDVWSEICEAYRRLSLQVGYSDPRVAVRSSSIEENGASFSGAYESYLNISGPDALRAAVKRVWASLWTGKAAAFRTRYGVTHEPAMAVIVQQMIDAPLSGAAITADPVTGNPHQVLVSCTTRTESQDISQYRVDLSGLELIKCDGSEQAPDEHLVSLVAEKAVLLEDVFGSRVQVQWAYDGELLWILQADQLADLPSYFPAGEVEETARWRRETLHSISPLARSIFWGSPRDISEPYPTRRKTDSSRLINGRVYRYIKEPSDNRDWTRNVASARKLQAEWEREIRPDLRDQCSDLMSADLAAMDSARLRRILRQAVDMVKQAACWLDWAEYPSLLFPELLRKMLRTRQEDDSLFFRLLGGLADDTIIRDSRLSELGERFAAAESQDKLADEKWWREYKADVEKFAREYGYSFTCRLERYDIASWKSWVEDTDTVFRMISAMTRPDSRPALLVRHTSAEQDARAAASECRKMLNGGQKKDFETLLSISRDWLALRNNIEHCFALVCTVLKRVLAEASARATRLGAYADNGDIYYLTIDEIDALLDNRSGADLGQIRGILARRKHELWLESRLEPPGALGDCEESPGPVCAGIGAATGRPRVARSIADAGEIEPGEILVVEEPGLAWTPFLAVAGGFVAEANLPGTAAIALDYGVPAVFGAPGALESAERSRKVELDTGEVSVVFRT